MLEDVEVGPASSSRSRGEAGSAKSLPSNSLSPVVKNSRNQQQIRATLDRQEPGPRDVDTNSAIKVLDGGSDSSLELDDGLSVVGYLVVDNDFEIHAVVVHYALDGAERDPEAVRRAKVSSAIVLLGFCFLPSPRRPPQRERETYLLVLKILNFLTLLKSST